MTDRDKLMIVGAVAGAALGAALAWGYYKQQTTGLWVKKREEGRTLAVQAGTMDFFRLGLSVFAVVREIQNLAKPKKA